MEDQKGVRQAMYGVNQVTWVLEAARVWKEEGIRIPESKIKYLESELAARTREARLVVPVVIEDKDFVEIPSFDFNVPIDPFLPSLTKGLEDAVLKREKEEEARRRDDVHRRRSSERRGGARAVAGRGGVSTSRP